MKLRRRNLLHLAGALRAPVVSQIATTRTYVRMVRSLAMQLAPTDTCTEI
jgi:hypothetical protein